jgi:phytoene dehydrogenase-like protein
MRAPSFNNARSIRLPNTRRRSSRRSGACHTITPRDLESTYGLSEGDLNHGQLILDQMFFMRPLPGWSNHKTPIDGLYLCGSGVHGGGGISGSSGRNAARIAK